MISLTQSITALAVIDFEHDVLPIIQEKCFRCHSARIAAPEGGVLLDSADAIKAGGDYGSIVEKMQPEKSVLFQRMTLPEGRPGIMPPTGKGDPATPEQLAVIRQWIKEGARFGNWEGIPEHEKNKPPKAVGNTRLSLQKYGTEEGLRLDLTPEPKHPVKMSNKLVRAKAREIDRLIKLHRKANTVPKPQPATDRIFVRRAYLGIVGRIPTHDEAVSFLASRDPGKRTELIDHLFSTEGYVSHWFHFWADLLKVQTTRFPSSVYYGEWMKDALRSNMPYDQFAYKLITATGMPYQNGATGWAASDANMAPDHMANNMQAFLGMQLQCAQCHDHPYDKWNQYEFQSLTSYFGGMRWNGVANKHFLNQIEKSGISISVKQEKYFGNNMAYRYREAVWEPVFNRWNRLPKDYQYADAKPREPVPPQVIFGHQPEIIDSPREAFGRWVTSEENQWFTVAVANRLWKKVMGVGLIEPVDHIKYDTQAQIPALMTYLEKIMKEADYNLKDFLRILYNTRTWQMETLSADLPENLAEYHYEGRPLMRMSGEQMWDSLVTLAIVDPDERKGHGSRYTAPEYRTYADKLYFTPIEELVAYYTDDVIDAEKAARKQAEKEAYKLFNSKSKRKAGRYGANFNTWSFDHMTDPRWHGLDRGLVRASELASPAPAYHFVRQFGQSDRKIIGTGRTDPNVTQVLNMLNGPIHYILDNDRSVLSKKIAGQETQEEKLNVIFRSVLTRNPTPEDLEIATAVLSANKGRTGNRMILWALLNTREFMYIQ
ncbi:DUF1549 domain-containing protein [Pontiella sp. NLcol2]|uniref:DUF1549 domain-containing protein n=2 Tax=Pontiella agarivorans TaxID=3038953 RepID=A0ABU5N048_9BACT|nr:DUF1549 domain-containing protein [Pontiella agarivorans]